MQILGTRTLATAQALALGAALGSATAYAAWLDAATLALWAVALGAGRAAMLLVDGGLKAALVRHPQALGSTASRRLTRCVLAAALALSLLALAAAGASVSASRVTPEAAALVAGSVIAYLMSHAGSLTALARLERAGRFDRVGRVEGAATVIEFALPAALLASGLAAPAALLAGVLLGRALRLLGLRHAARAERVPAANALPAPPWRDALPMQGIAALAMLRDQVHLWLIGPLFGAAWAGAYAFALMACALASQVLLATAARVAMPALRALPPRRRALRAARGLRRLAWVTVPLLALTWPLVHVADATWWNGQWSLAVALLPALLLRMLAALPLAVLAPWLAVALPPRDAAVVHARWTAIELLLVAAAVAWMGPAGLAVAWALGGALGTLVFARALRGQGLGLFVQALMRVPMAGRRRWSMSTSC